MDLRTYTQLYGVTSNGILDEEERRLRSAAIIGGVSYETLLEQPLTATTEMVEATVFLFERPRPEKIRRSYTLNGRKYYPFKAMEEMSTAQYIDYQSVIVEVFEEHLLDLMYIILIPEGHTYNDGYSREQVMEDLGTLSVTEALGIADFFLRRYRRLLRRTLLYSDATMRLTALRAPKEMRKELKTLAKEHSRKVSALLSMSGSVSLRRLLQ